MQSPLDKLFEKKKIGCKNKSNIVIHTYHQKLVCKFPKRQLSINVKYKIYKFNSPYPGPSVATSAIFCPDVYAMYPRTENMTNPDTKDVAEFMKLVRRASLKN